MKDYITEAFTDTESGLNGELNNLTVNCLNSKNNNFNLDCEGNLFVNSVTTVSGVTKKVWLPVGTLYWNKKDVTEEMNLYFEGTWKRVKDVFILAAGDKYQAGTAGGEEQHTLTVEELPRHFHCYGYTVKTFYDTGEGVNTIENIQTSGTGKENYVWERPAGDNLPHNNMPPYEVSYCWERIE